VESRDGVLDLLHQGRLVAVSSTGVVSGTSGSVGVVRHVVGGVGGVVSWVVSARVRSGKAGRGVVVSI
jgi:hypothetical protein